MHYEHAPKNPFNAGRIKQTKLGTPVSKATVVAGKRIGGAIRAEQKRQQKRKDSR